jgi:hypothetical protein
MLVLNKMLHGAEDYKSLRDFCNGTPKPSLFEHEIAGTQEETKGNEVLELKAFL